MLTWVEHEISFFITLGLVIFKVKNFNKLHLYPPQKCTCNLYLFMSMGRFSRWQILDICLIFPENTLSCFIQSVYPCMKCQSLFCGEKRKTYFKMSSAWMFYPALALDIHGFRTWILLSCTPSPFWKRVYTKIKEFTASVSLLAHLELLLQVSLCHGLLSLSVFCSQSLIMGP